jgi:hypothetical protein
VFVCVHHSSLDRHIANPAFELTPLFALRAAVDAACALAFLHANCVLHLDMKPGMTRACGGDTHGVRMTD